MQILYNISWNYNYENHVQTICVKNDGEFYVDKIIIFFSRHPAADRKWRKKNLDNSVRKQKICRIQ